MKKNIFKLLFVLVLIFSILFILEFCLKNNKKQKVGEGKNILMLKKDKKVNSKISMVATINDKIGDNALWAGTTNLVWNDMLDKFNNGKEAKVTPESTISNNLNKKDFTKEMIPDNYYYIKASKMKEGLREEIEKEIKEKFNEESNLLKNINWEFNENKYLFYSMIFREFEFKKAFKKQDNAKFKNYENVKYFGTYAKNNKTEEQIKDQIDILYYNNDEDFAVSINTKDGDKLIVNKKPNGENFKEIYENILKKQKEYEKSGGDIRLQTDDEFKMPNIEFYKLHEYSELKNNIVEFEEKDPFKIEKVIQGIEFSLNEKGGKVKSESAIIGVVMGAIENEKPKKLYVDDTFAIFLQNGDNMPYFALKTDDISLIQKDIK